MNKGIKLIILSVILIVAIVWIVISVQNVFKAQQEVEIAERELAESLQAMDVALEDCLSAYTYDECKQASIDGCIDVATRDQCEENFIASYQRIINS
ncbi:MAG TPA: hypothetical protein VFG77_00505 [Nitrososphaeraceae archaeon]|nr:hypothetical protein [Nitrososphaeraceae archaeon]